MPRLWHRNVSYFREIINTYKNQNRETTIDSKQKAILIAKLASQKKAEEIVILDMKKISNLCDYFIICHASSDRKVKAIAQGIDEGLEEINTKVWHREGEQEALWVLLDIGDIVVHIFDEEIRGFYNLEYLWREAPRVEWDADN